MRSPRHARHVLGTLRAVFSAAPALGAAYVLALTLVSLRGAVAPGEGAGADLGRTRTAIVATAIGLGLVVGLFAEGLLFLRARRRSGAAAVIEPALLVAALHAALVLWSMADAPQLYATSWYAKGGLPRTVQVIATDVLGTRGVVLAAIAAAVAYVRPSRIAYLARRAVVAVRAPVRRRLLAVGIGTASAAALLASSIEPGPPEASVLAIPEAHADPEPRMNVLVIAADALRADRLEPRVAPVLSALAARGTRLDRAYVSLPRTLPSWVTLLTGRYGHHHGIRSNVPTWEQRARDFDALPARLAGAGYATRVVGDHAADVFGRIDLGFARADVPGAGIDQREIRRMLEQQTALLPTLGTRLGRRLFPVLRGLAEAADPKLLAEDASQALREMKDRPFFMTVFFSSTGAPYAAPAPYYAKYTDRAYRGRFKYGAPAAVGSDPPPDAADVKQIRALYDGAVTAVDDAVAHVLGTLERLRLADRTIVVVTSDHGEALYENGRGRGHGDHLFGDEGTHVPLVVIDPRIPGKSGGRRERHVVRDVDLAPTLYELTGVAPSPAMDGRSFAAALRGEPIDDRLAFGETGLWLEEELPALPPDMRIPYPAAGGLTERDAEHGGELVLRADMTAITRMARHRMVRDERYKLVYVPARGGVRYLLFDTELDPAETADVAEARPEVVTRLRADLWRWMLEDGAMQQKDGWLLPRPGAEVHP